MRCSKLCWNGVRFFDVVLVVVVVVEGRDGRDMVKDVLVVRMNWLMMKVLWRWSSWI